MTRKSESYLCTLDVFSTSDMQMLEVIRKTVSLSNRRMANKKRVVVRGRKPMNKMIVPASWYKRGTMVHVSYDFGGNIVGGIKKATKLDVYIYDRA